jgi:hypothetical protein
MSTLCQICRPLAPPAVFSTRLAMLMTFSESKKKVIAASGRPCASAALNCSRCESDSSVFSGISKLETTSTSPGQTCTFTRTGAFGGICAIKLVIFCESSAASFPASINSATRGIGTFPPRSIGPM